MFLTNLYIKIYGLFLIDIAIGHFAGKTALRPPGFLLFLRVEKRLKRVYPNHRSKNLYFFIEQDWDMAVIMTALGVVKTKICL